MWEILSSCQTKYKNIVLESYLKVLNIAVSSQKLGNYFLVLSIRNPVCGWHKKNGKIKIF